MIISSSSHSTAQAHQGIVAEPDSQERKSDERKMRAFIVFSCLVLAVSARPEYSYNPPSLLSVGSHSHGSAIAGPAIFPAPGMTQANGWTSKQVGIGSSRFWWILFLSSVYCSSSAYLSSGSNHTDHRAEAHLRKLFCISFFNSFLLRCDCHECLILDFRCTCRQ